MSESSPRQEATAKPTDTSDKESLVECPECDQLFNSHRGMRIHLGKAHKSRKDISCEECGNVFNVTPNRAESARFCSAKCRDKWCARDRMVERVGVECQQCGEIFEVTKEKSTKRQYCSRSCADAGWVSRVDLECAVCGDSYEIIESEASESKYCSSECMYKGQTGMFAGENNPMWSGGRYNYYGPNWNEQRERALRRDGYECQLCGLSQEKHHRSLCVHHITPRKQYKKENGELKWRVANRLDNLVSLCDACHKRVENMAPLIPENIR